MPFIPPTDDELQKVRQLKESLQATPDIVISPRVTDVTILRFLRGSKGKEAKALTELVKHCQWRQEADADNVEAAMPRFQKQLDKRLAVFGSRDREGRPSAFGFAHKHNARDRDPEEMKLFIIYTLETLVKSADPEQEMFSAVVDMSRFTMKCMDFEVTKIGVAILQGNYPDTLGKILLVDAPMIFSGCWAIIRPWLDPVTASKVAFIKRAQLEEYYDPENIPSFDD